MRDIPYLMGKLQILCCKTGSETLSGTTSTKIKALINPQALKGLGCYAADCFKKSVYDPVQDVISVT